MPEARHLLRTVCLYRAIVLISLLLALPGCHLFVTPRASAPGNPADQPLTTQSGHLTRHSASRSIPKAERLHLQVDSSASTALLAITLDPLRLAPRRSASRCPLKGTVTGTLKTSSTGTRSFTIEKIDLVTAGDSRLEFDWSPLIGTVKILIPSGILTIRDHTSPPEIPLQRNGRFSHPACLFRVGGSCQVEGTGLILKKKVGKMEGDLTIDQTDPVALTGSLSRQDGRWILSMPSTVMKDRFEVDEDGTVLDLIFTGRISAVEKQD